VQDKKEKEKKDYNPDYEDLFAGGEPNLQETAVVDEEEKEQDIIIDPRNTQANIGFIDVMGFKIRNEKVRAGQSW